MPSSGRVLPVALTPLLGREHEIVECLRLLGATRLLSITGAGGCGKTRLALELAHRAAASYEHAVWVDLASLADDRLIAHQILAALGVRESPATNVLELLIETIAEGTTLLVLDNCEHLVHGAASIAEEVLRTAAGTRIVATTREPLGIPGEQTWLVPPLATGDAVQLFVERARAASPSFAIDEKNRPAIEHICERLDGIPLAIELAAARVKVLPVDQIAQRLDDAFALLTSGSRTLARHRTIREAIDWSFRLLSGDEQALLRRLAVFTGGFTLEAAEGVCEGDVMQTLAALVDKSLASAAGGRYRLLETVRQFAAAKLDESGERERYRERHARFFLTLLERSEGRIYAGGVDLAMLAMLDEEIGNIRAAIDWAGETPERIEIELRLLWDIHWYWFARGHFHEARRRLDVALTRAANADAVVRARAMVAAGNAAVWQGDWAAIRPQVDDAIAILRPSNNTRAFANALLLIGCAQAFGAGDDDAAKEAFDESVAAARRNGRNVALALTLYWSGIAAMLRNDWTAARAALQETFDVGVERRNLPAIGHGATILAQVALHERRLDEAAELLDRAIASHLQTGDRWGLTQAVEGVGLMLIATGDAEPGTRLLAAAAAAWLQMGARPGRRDDFQIEKDKRIREALGDDRLRTVLASGAAMHYDAMVALARERLDALLLGKRHVAASAPSHEPALRVRALGALEILRHGRAIDGGSSSARAQELLLYLLCHPAGASREEIGVALWPDLDSARLRNNFHVTVHRLRKTLGGAEWVTVERDVYALDRSQEIDFDAETFEREVKGALRGGDTSRLQLVLSLYRGDFGLGSGAGDWHLPIRNRLRDLYGEALRIVGRAHLASGDFRAAADIYQRLIALDDLDEQAYRNLMTALAKTGDPAGAARTYRRLVEVFERELDAEPDPASTRLHARIAAGEV
jgi:predicted ATPase/DNA-binding SARP family transcriptional activator